MKRALFEAEKNYITCAVLMIVVGICLIAMGKTGLGVGCIVIGVTFAVAAVYMIATNDKEPPKKEKPVKEKKVKKKEDEEK